MTQLDVAVSPPAFVWNPYLTLNNVTFDPDPGDLSSIFYLVNYFLVTDRRTDGQTDRQTDRRRRIRAHRACCTGGLKKAGHTT